MPASHPTAPTTLHTLLHPSRSCSPAHRTLPHCMHSSIHPDPAIRVLSYSLCSLTNPNSTPKRQFWIQRHTAHQLSLLYPADFIPPKPYPNPRPNLTYTCSLWPQTVLCMSDTSHHKNKNNMKDQGCVFPLTPLVCRWQLPR